MMQPTETDIEYIPNPNTDNVFKNCDDVANSVIDLGNHELENYAETGIIIIRVLKPEKLGDGMSSYVVYTIKTQTSSPIFSNESLCVQRRFSDFIRLHEELKSKYLSKGIIIPYPPEKNVFGSTKFRISKNSSTDSNFIEKRRSALEWWLYFTLFYIVVIILFTLIIFCISFLNRICVHHVLRQDECVKQFLEIKGDFPKHFGMQTNSGLSAKRILKNVGDVVGKLAFKITEVDEYFEIKEEELENWDIQANRLYSALLNLVADENGLASTTLAFSKSISALANVEEHTGLARALGQLGDTEEQISQFHIVQAEAESAHLAEYSRGVLNMIQACKETLAERVRIFKLFKDTESALRCKREQKVRIEMSPKSDRAKMPTLDREIEELVNQVEVSEEEFEKISTTIKKEFEFIDESRFEEYKAAVVAYLTTMLQIQEKALKSWESFIGHAKAIE